ncbi:hypothetical protein BD309DRAFT_1002574 [Dichomitus squalens]|uniref:uncharacterized protein n=1 Tax=Dichomitus squalens (strain LYAD-421) TaxID=732165 RepID=UPI00044150D4|nr:uncharacterized protein DICSQDRAFT_143017 [Dichomitus squalens LYAD-421 SS1]EJF67511.1 hypothetical protein DICSQDRAFT_143017 [Dichomitus squalens LYAD-421 SS1]TBU41276.1 hypothetical protein BD309DRAFT_1002574 [Dichomitus squalens]
MDHACRASLLSVVPGGLIIARMGPEFVLLHETRIRQRPMLRANELFHGKMAMPCSLEYNTNISYLHGFTRFGIKKDQHSHENQVKYKEYNNWDDVRQ